jgi:hypothetical protein
MLGSASGPSGPSTLPRRRADRPHVFERPPSCLLGWPPWPLRAIGARCAAAVPTCVGRARSTIATCGIWCCHEGEIWGAGIWCGTGVRAVWGSIQVTIRNKGYSVEVEVEVDPHPAKAAGGRRSNRPYVIRGDACESQLRSEWERAGRRVERAGRRVERAGRRVRITPPAVHVHVRVFL